MGRRARPRRTHGRAGALRRSPQGGRLPHRGGLHAIRGIVSYDEARAYVLGSDTAVYDEYLVNTSKATVRDYHCHYARVDDAHPARDLPACTPRACAATSATAIPRRWWTGRTSRMTKVFFKSTLRRRTRAGASALVSSTSLSRVAKVHYTSQSKIAPFHRFTWILTVFQIIITLSKQR